MIQKIQILRLGNSSSKVAKYHPITSQFFFVLAVLITISSRPGKFPSAGGEITSPSLRVSVLCCYWAGNENQFYQRTLCHDWMEVNETPMTKSDDLRSFPQTKDRESIFSFFFCDRQWYGCVPATYLWP